MISGEHAVLRGELGIVGAINRRLSATLRPRSDDQIVVISSLGRLEGSRFELPNSPSFQVVRGVIQSFQPILPSGFEVEITSEIEANLGLGTSAAVCVVVTAILKEWTNHPDRLDSICLKVIRSLQRFASGGDILASIHGGLLAYRMDQEPLSLPWLPPLTVVYSGSKMPTADVIQFVQEKEREEPEEYAAYYEIIGRISGVMVQKIQKKEIEWLGKYWIAHHMIQQLMGVSHPVLDQICESLSAIPTISGAKISGSGLGDCVIGLGSISKNDYHGPGTLLEHIELSPQGLIVQTS